MQIKDKAICIRTVDYSETSQVVTFFTRQTGKVAVIAKGSKRVHSSFGGPVEIFSCGSIVFSDSGRDKMGTLIEFEQIAEKQVTSTISGDIDTLNCCLFAVELVNLLTTDYDPHPGLFDALMAFLNKVNRDSKNVLAQLVIFQLNLLREIGLSPVFEFCMNCKNHINAQSQQAYFSNNARGLICKDCQGAFPDAVAITEKAVNCLADVNSIVSADEPTIEEIEGVLISYFTDVLGRVPKMAKYISRT